jgi:hypothetical protein
MLCQKPLDITTEVSIFGTVFSLNYIQQGNFNNGCALANTKWKLH